MGEKRKMIRVFFYFSFARIQPSTASGRMSNRYISMEAFRSFESSEEETLTRH